MHRLKADNEDQHDHFVVTQQTDEQHHHRQAQYHSAPHPQALLDRFQFLHHHIHYQMQH